MTTMATDTKFNESVPATKVDSGLAAQIEEFEGKLEKNGFDKVVAQAKYTGNKSPSQMITLTGAFPSDQKTKFEEMLAELHKAEVPYGGFAYGRNANDKNNILLIPIIGSGIEI